MSKGVTPQKQNYAAWYTDVVAKSDLADNGPVRGTMIVKPYGFALWDNIQKALDNMLKATNHENAYFPMLIPKSFLAQEAAHIEGFAKECAVVTHTRLKALDDKSIIVDPDSKLEEEVIIRPTSETIVWSMYKKWIQSYRDLPLLINQWVNIVRWEMRTRLFLRTTEFLWQEGHTAHATAEEAENEALLILDIYRQLAEDYLAIPVLTGIKSESEKFAGADQTYCIEAMMGDKRALQSGTTHYLGTNFAKAFDVKFQTKDNREQFVYATSWGVSTRLVGAVIMVHGDDQGLKLPPKIAPVQVILIPIARNDDQKTAVKSHITSTLAELRKAGVRIKEDWRDESPGFKFHDWEMKGVPLRMEVGLRDIEKDEVVLVRRDTGAKIAMKVKDIVTQIPQLLATIQANMFQQAKAFLEKNTTKVDTYDQFKETLKNNGGFIKCGWDGKAESEKAIKEETKATIRCIPFDENHKGKKCVYSGKPAKYEVIFAKSY